MKRTLTIILLWTLVIAWMGVIFAFSHQSAVDSGNVSEGVAEKVYEKVDIAPAPHDFKYHDAEWITGQYEIFLRKSAHLFQYAVLGVLLTAAVSYICRRFLTTFCLSAGAGILYGVADEVHQYFVPGRSCRLTDIAIDAAGVLSGCLATILVLMVIRRIRRKKGEE